MFLGPALVTFVFASFRLRRKILEAGKLEIEPEQIKALYHVSQNKLSPLKWGLVGLFAGMGLIVIQFLPFDANTTLPWGIEITCIAIGFLIYYFVAKNMSSEA